MAILKSINAGRRFLMQGITKNIGSSYLKLPNNDGANIEVKRVLICRPNGRLGNLLLITPLVQEITATFPDCKIDLFVKGGLAPILFKNYPNVSSIIQLPGKPFKHLIKYIQAWAALRKYDYDIVINVSKNSSSGKLSAQFANSKYFFSGDFNEELQLKYEDYGHIAKYAVYNFRYYLSQLGFKNTDEAIPPLNLRLSYFELDQGKKELDKLVNNDKKTICLFTYATGAKCYSESCWGNFYMRLKAEYPNHNIIEVLPKENVSQIGFQAPTFYSNDVRQIGALIANAELFIGADSGITHLASSVHTPTVALFSVTDPNTYRPYSNSSVAITADSSITEDAIKIIKGILFSCDISKATYSRLGVTMAAIISYSSASELAAAFLV